MSLWKSIRSILKAAYYEAFPLFPFHIVAKEIDNITKRAIFDVKAKRIPTPIKLTTRELLENDRYITGISRNDRKKIEEQYLLELNHPLAYIEEYPIEINENNQYIFKMLLLTEKKIVCGSATFFIKENKEILSMLSHGDVVKIAMAYYKENFLVPTDPKLHVGSNNVHYLK